MTDTAEKESYAGIAPPRKNQEPQQMPEAEPMLEPKQAGMQMDNQSPRKDREQRRQQAGQQSDQGLIERGLGYGAEDGEEMEEAPDVTQR